MTLAFNIKFSGQTDPFDEWYFEEKGSGGDFELESDVDECIEDDYSDNA